MQKQNLELISYTYVKIKKLKVCYLLNVEPDCEPKLKMHVITDQNERKTDAFDFGGILYSGVRSY